jgi:hypothetical protein
MMMTSQPNAPAARRDTAGSPSGGWLTAVLRPAGTLDGASAAARLAGPGKCLLLANAPIAPEVAVSLAGVPAATLAANPVPPEPDQVPPVRAAVTATVV